MSSHRTITLGLLAAVMLAALPTSALAQDGFLFRAPIASVTLRAGPHKYLAQSDVFDDITKNLTVDRNDFLAASFGGELAISFTPQLDAVIGAGFARKQTSSEFRDFVEPNPTPGGPDLPIEQTTELRTVPLTLTLRYQFIPRWRRISDLAWIPARTTPYIGVGGGLTNYKLSQNGDFVNFTTFAISGATIETSGSAFTYHGVAGADHWISPYVGLNLEARYTHGSAVPDRGFSSFDRLDLSGAQVSLGLSLRW